MQVNRVHFSTIGSTNSWAKEQAHEFNRQAITIITTDEQTAGRGRFKRAWISPKGCNLHVTYVFYQNTIVENIGNLPQILALSAYDAIQVITQDVALKWPNDLMIGKAKLGGILCEVIDVGAEYAIVIGLGLNINMQKSFFQKIDRPVTSLLELTGSIVDKNALSEQIHMNFTKNLEAFLSQGFSSFLEPFRSALIHKKGDLICFSNYEKVVEGEFEGINPDGSLSLVFPDGITKRFVSGELVE